MPYARGKNGLERKVNLSPFKRCAVRQNPSVACRARRATALLHQALSTYDVPFGREDTVLRYGERQPRSQPDSIGSRCAGKGRVIKDRFSGPNPIFFTTKRRGVEYDDLR